MSPFQIQPTIGVGPLRLGMSRDSVRAQFGEPDEVEEATEVDGVTYQDWTYALAGLGLHFSAEQEWRLERIRVRATTATLGDIQFIGMTETRLRELSLAARVGPLTLEFNPQGLNLREYEWDNQGLSFWVEDGKVTCVCVGPVWNTSTDEPIWPPDPSP